MHTITLIRINSLEYNTKFHLVLDFNISNVRPKKRAAAQITIASSQACSQPDLLPLCRQYTTLVIVAAALEYIANHKSCGALFFYYRSFCQSNMALRPRNFPRFVRINSKLPNELLTMVFQFLPFEDLNNVLLVCRLALL